MPTIIGIKFNSTGKMYYFDPKKYEFEVGDGVIVETMVGQSTCQQYAFCCKKNTEVPEDELKVPLKPIIRKADEKDKKVYEENKKRGEKALRICAEKVEKHKLNMKLLEAEYTFDRSKVLIKYTADGRVDFRELVKDLATELHMRIELRQLYEKEEVILKGAMGLCGQECCCIRCPGVCDKATVKMAKCQNISLNPTKVGGACGKLMCCLKFENDFYADMVKKMPKIGSNVKTNDGIGRVLSVNMLREFITVSTQIDDSFVEKRYDLGEFELMKSDNKNQKEEEEEIDPEIKNME